MKKSQRLRPVVSVTEKNERSAAKALAGSKRVLDESLSRLEHLHAYRNEYMERFRSMGEKGISVQQAQEYRFFLANLEAAVTHQKSFVEMCQADYEEKRELWYVSRSKVKALGTVITRHEKTEQYELMRREQKELDDSPRHASKRQQDE